MNRTPDDASRLLALMVAICGPEIAQYLPKMEALAATSDANARLKADEAPSWRSANATHVSDQTGAYRPRLPSGAAPCARRTEVV